MVRLCRKVSIVSPSGNGIKRELIAHVLHDELQTGGQLHRFTEGLWYIAKETPHLGCAEHVTIGVLLQEHYVVRDIVLSLLEHCFLLKRSLYDSIAAMQYVFRAEV